MTTFNTDYNNTELLDQELTIDQLEYVAGGFATMQTISGIPGDHLAAVGSEIYHTIVGTKGKGFLNSWGNDCFDSRGC